MIRNNQLFCGIVSEVDKLRRLAYAESKGYLLFGKVSMKLASVDLDIDNALEVLSMFRTPIVRYIFDEIEFIKGEVKKYD